MQRLLLALSMIVLLAGSAAAHGNISKLPDTVQILQYKMKLHMNADDADTKNNLAMAYFRTGQLDKATEQLESVLDKDPNNFNALDGMGIVLIKQGNAAEALQYLGRALAINNKDIMLHAHFYVAHTQLDQPGLAQKEMNKIKAMASGSKELTAVEQEIKLVSKS